MRPQSALRRTADCNLREDFGKVVRRSAESCRPNPTIDRASARCARNPSPGASLPSATRRPAEQEIGDRPDACADRGRAEPPSTTAGRPRRRWAQTAGEDQGPQLLAPRCRARPRAPLTGPRRRGRGSPISARLGWATSRERPSLPRTVERSRPRRRAASPPFARRAEREPLSTAASVFRRVLVASPGEGAALGLEAHQCGDDLRDERPAREDQALGEGRAPRRTRRPIRRRSSGATAASTAIRTPGGGRDRRGANGAGRSGDR